MTPRKLVQKTLDFDNPSRVPRQLWLLPWAEERYPAVVHDLHTRFPADITGAPERLATPTISTGDAYAIGSYRDPWGALFTQKASGHIGEVKEPVITDDSWEDLTRVHVPVERLTFDRDAVDAYVRQTDLFVTSPNVARPFEQLQFLRGTENLYIDLLDPPPAMLSFIARMHAYYCELAEEWARTDVDAISFMDDWGAQQALLINPTVWRQIFKPMYADYIRIAHDHGKRAFMHSDGHTLAIYPDLIELGLDAFNSQIFCMGVEELTQFAGKITFWGEIDRQYLLAQGTQTEVRDAVRDVYNGLWRNGGCIAQCEFGVGAKPQNVVTVFEEWDAFRVG